MHFKLVQAHLESFSADIIAVGCFEGSKGAKAKLLMADGGASLDRLFAGNLSQMIAREGFSGKEGTQRLLFTAGRCPARYILLIGLGPKKEFSRAVLRNVGAAMARQAQELKASSLALVVQREGLLELPPAQRLQALVEGFILGAYRFDRYRTNHEEGKPLHLTVSFLTAGPHAPLEQAIAGGQMLGEAICFARDLCNLPSNDLTPTKLAREAQAVAKREGLGINVLHKPDLEKENMGAFLAIAQGAAEPPCLIHLTYRPRKKAKGKVALVGKGVTFDTGGISLKPPKNMHEMKSDMAGGAAVLATMQAIARLKPNIVVDGYIPSSENVVDARSVKPGDIVTARNGKTIEIINTDAEGRLLLADTLSYAADRKPDCIIDLATLTGGAIYALGELYAAVLGTDQRLIDKILKASTVAGENIWQLPLEKRYLKGIQKGPADLVNSGGSQAQTIGAALFLSQFVGQTKWAHLDIAPCAWSNEETPLCCKGGTGTMVSTLVNLFCTW